MYTVMIVDDAQFMRVSLSKLLTGLGYKVVEAENGAQAVQTYQAVIPDAVLMDVAMPEKDGLEALAEIYSFDPKAKVIMLAAVGQESTILQAVKAGAKDYVVKPFDPACIMAALRKVLGQIS